MIGDLQAQMAACVSGERELCELFERYGLDTVLGYADHLHDYAERLARAEIAELPDGVYRFVDHSAPRRRVSLVEEGTTQTVVGLIW